MRFYLIRAYWLFKSQFNVNEEVGVDKESPAIFIFPRMELLLSKNAGLRLSTSYSGITPIQENLSLDLSIAFLAVFASKTSGLSLFMH